MTSARFRSAPVVALAVLITWVVPAAAQNAKLPPWDEPKAKAESRRVLKQIVAVVNASERNDGRLALVALRDDAWVVRLIGAVRLSAMGIDRPTGRALKRSARPDGKPLPTNSPPLTAAAAFVAKTPRAKLAEGPFSRITTTEALRTWTGFVVERFLSGRETDRARHQMLVAILAGRHVIPRTSRGWLAAWLLARLDQKTALADLKAKTAKAAAGKDGAPVFAWYRANRPYLYWHAAGKRFRIDAAARAAKTASATFRKTTPWKADEGPNAPADEARKQQ